MPTLRFRLCLALPLSRLCLPLARRRFLALALLLDSFGLAAGILFATLPGELFLLLAELLLLLDALRFQLATFLDLALAGGRILADAQLTPK